MLGGLQKHLINFAGQIPARERFVEKTGGLQDDNPSDRLGLGVGAHQRFLGAFIFAAQPSQVSTPLIPDMISSSTTNAMSFRCSL